MELPKKNKNKNKNLSLGLGSSWTQAQAQVLADIAKLLSMLRVAWWWNFFKKTKKDSHGLGFLQPSPKLLLASRVVWQWSFFFFFFKPKLEHGFFLDPSPSFILGGKSSLMRNKNPSPRLNFCLQGFERKYELKFGFLFIFNRVWAWLRPWVGALSQAQTQLFSSKKMGARGRRTHLSMKLLQIGLSNPWTFYTFSFFLQTQVQNKNDLI